MPDLKAIPSRGLRATAYTLITVTQAAVCGALILDYTIDVCDGGNRGPGGGFSAGILALMVTFVMSVVGYHVARYLSGALRSRGAGPRSVLGTYLIFSPLLPTLFMALVRAFAWTVGACQSANVSEP